MRDAPSLCRSTIYTSFGHFCGLCGTAHGDLIPEQPTLDERPGCPRFILLNAFNDGLPNIHDTPTSSWSLELPLIGSVHDSDRLPEAIVSVERAYLSRIRAGIRNLRVGRVPRAEVALYVRSLEGSINYVHLMQPQKAAKLRKELNAAQISARLSGTSNKEQQ